MTTNFSGFGLLVLMAALVLGTFLATRGARLLNNDQKRELEAGNPNVPAMALLLAVLACSLFARTYALYAVMAAVVLSAIWAYVLLPKFMQSAWPLPARSQLVAGSVLIAFGALSVVVATALGWR